MAIRSTQSRNRRGVALVYAAALIIVLIGFVGLAVDVGRAQYAKGQLQVLADVCARAAARGISDGTALAKANAVAAYNAPDNAPITFTAGEVQTGTWNASTKTFTAGGTPANAVRVTASRTAAKGNALPMLFLQLLGTDTVNISGSAVVTGGTVSFPYGVIGGNNAHVATNAMVDSYDSSVAPYSAAWTPDRGTVASNGPITLVGSATVRGDARPGPGHAATGGTVTGVRTPLTSELTLPAPSTNGYSTSNNNNTNIPATYRPSDDFSVTTNVTVNLPAGNYYFDEFTMTAGTLNVTGAATVYVSRLTIDGPAKTSAHRPQNLRFIVYGNNVDLLGTGDVYADVYAPLANVRIDNGAALFGRVVAKTLHMDQNSRLHVDESLVAGGGAGGGATAVVQIVQ